jgi:hypothetical protein
VGYAAHNQHGAKARRCSEKLCLTGTSIFFHFVPP